jgi:hypothetical protein
MALTLLVHVSNEDPLLLEVERMPEPGDTCIIGMHPRRRDNKEVHYILPEVTTVIFPMARINFIEVMPSGEDEDLFGLVRE